MSKEDLESGFGLGSIVRAGAFGAPIAYGAYKSWQSFSKSPDMAVAESMLKGGLTPPPIIQVSNAMKFPGTAATGERAVENFLNHISSRFNPSVHQGALGASVRGAAGPEAFNYAFDIAKRTLPEAERGRFSGMVPAGVEPA
jgi:hypothetical protein